VPAWLGCVAYHQNSLDMAQAYIEEGLAIQDPNGYWPELAFSLLCRGEVARAMGNPDEALRYYARSLKMVAKHRLGPSVPPYLEAFARLAVANAQPSRAARLLGAAAKLREEIGTAVPPVEQADFDKALAQARDQLGTAAFEAAWNEGWALDWEQAAAYALET
jgi:tetratricopeptide (TPR) repeat protein